MSPHIPPHRPPWWPADEPWPPTGPRQLRQAWRGRFGRRVGCFFALLLLMAFASGVGGLWLTTQVFDQLGLPRDTVPFLCFSGFVVLVFALAWGGRGVWRLTAPISDLMEAAGRIQAGDYSVRVNER